MKPATVLLSGALLLSAAGGASAQTPGVTSAADIAKAGMDPERLARIPARMKEFVENGEMAGAVMLVARHGVVALLEAVGYQDLETKKPMRTNTIFQIRSMTKSVVAVGIMILMEEGLLTLTDPVEVHLPEFRGQMMVDLREQDRVLALKKPSRPIIIRDLLTHTSGILSDDQRIPEELKDQSGRVRRDKTLAEITRAVSQPPLEFEPGSEFLYSTFGFRTLQRLSEVVANQPYEKFLEERIFRPLGMTDTFTGVVPREKQDRLASVYRVENQALKKCVRCEEAPPPGDLYSTARDMAAFYQMMLNGGTYNGVRILSRSSVEVMTTPHTSRADSRLWARVALMPRETSLQVFGGYGLGWLIVTGPKDSGALWLQSVGTYGHGGSLRTVGWVDPKKDLVCIFMVQQQPRVPATGVFATLAASAIVD